MDYKAPFLALPDYRENLVCDLVLGNPASSTIPDESGSSANGAMASAVREADGIIGKKILNFSGSSAAKILISSNNPVVGGAGKTYMFLIKPTAALESYLLFQYLFRMQATTHGGYRTFSFELQNDPENISISMFNTGAHQYSLNEWQLFTAVIDPANDDINLYVNLVLVNNNNGNWVDGTEYTNADTFILFRDEEEGFNFKGNGAMFRCYDEALTLTQIKQIYQYIRRHILSMRPKI